MFFRVRKSKRTSRVRCYFIMLKLRMRVRNSSTHGSVYECTELNYLFSFYKMLLNSFRQLVNNLCYILKHFVNTQILHSYVNDKNEVNFLRACFENKAVSG